jgi:UDP-N-acetylmuramoyl-L-alanyl-D-glutamate--2,6-diaminopimelate ligase
MLFTPERTDHGVVCVDTDGGAELARIAGVAITTVSTDPDRRADCTVTVSQADAAGSHARVRLPEGEVSLRVGMPGEFNVTNAAVALVMLVRHGLDPELAAHGIAGLTAVPGRMERIESGQPFAVLVDYAHTPDALRRVLTSVRAAAEGRVIVVVGCGGDRDRGKRPEMGQIAARLSDLVVLTDDNPRSEESGAILAAVAAGAARVGEAERAEVRVIPDRAAAIRSAIDAATAGDIVLVAGKGAEQGQEVAGVVTPFDDRDQVRTALAEAGWR